MQVQCCELLTYTIVAYTVEFRNASNRDCYIYKLKDYKQYKIIIKHQGFALNNYENLVSRIQIYRLLDLFTSYHFMS